jgi:phosphohistidine phosphatase
MKQLFLLRHGKSSWENRDLADHDRPLALRGRRASKAMAEHLRRERITPALVLCSSSRRTRETLEPIAAGVSDDVEVLVERNLYAASAEDLLDRLHAVADDVESVLLIGHNPAIQQFALRLAGTGAEINVVRQKFPTAALATLGFNSGWGELAPGSAELIAFVTPKELDSSAA